MCVKGRGSCLPAAQRLIFQLQSVLWAFFFLTCNICPAFPMVDMDLALKLPHAVRWRIVKASLLKGSVELDITSHPNVLFSHANKFEEDSFYYLCGVSHRSSLRNHASYLPHEDLELSLLSYYYFCSILKKKGRNYKRVCVWSDKRSGKLSNMFLQRCSQSKTYLLISSTQWPIRNVVVLWQNSPTTDRLFFPHVSHHNDSKWTHFKWHGKKTRKT